MNKLNLIYFEDLNSVRQKRSGNEIRNFLIDESMNMVVKKRVGERKMAEKLKEMSLENMGTVVSNVGSMEKGAALRRLCNIYSKQGNAQVLMCITI